MSELIYSKVTEQKKEKVASKPMKSGDGGLVLTIVTITTISFLIAVGFAYMGYTSGHYSQAYVLCKDNVLAEVRTGAYQSLDEITSALKTCEGV